MTAMGGSLGLTVAIGGAVEYQQNSNPHFHGNVHLASAYQHNSLMEIATMIKAKTLDPEAVKAWHSWVLHEEHLDVEQHEPNTNEYETSWNMNNKGRECDNLCQLPHFIATGDCFHIAIGFLRTSWQVRFLR